METAATAVKEPSVSEVTPDVNATPLATQGGADETSVERRKEVRLTMKIPVTLSWVDSLGESVEDLTFTRDVSNSGCRVVLKRSLEEGTVIVCQNNSTRKVAKGKVVWSRSEDIVEAGEEGSLAGFELGELDPDFWGDEFLVALIEAGALPPMRHPEVVEKKDEARCGLLYALMSSVLYFFLGGYSAWAVLFEVSPLIQNVFAPLVFLAGIALAGYSSIQAIRRASQVKADSAPSAS